ncbi:hypothetical protein HZA55_00315 [Candidatus Poribacteria bacterium]|nr:hypothetical protein [Candidatus Poribacteria bacterium]
MKLKYFLFFVFMHILSLACSTSPQNDDISNTTKKDIIISDPSEEFAGSIACKDCHLNIYNRWKENLHSGLIRDPKSDQSIIADSDYNGIDDFKQGIALGDITNTPRNDTSFLFYWNARVSPSLRYTNADGYLVNIDKNYPIIYTIGSAAQEQLFLTKINDLLFVLPIQYNAKNNTWIFYDSTTWYTGTTPQTPKSNSSWEKNCSGCHTTGVVYAGKNSNDEYVASYKELNIGCEACHGSGLNHIDTNGKTDTIINPSKLTFQRANDICASCHARGKSYPNGTFPFPWDDSSNIGFRPGKNISKFFSIDNIYDLADSNNQTHAQSVEFNGSSHVSAGLTCYSCHDPHNGQYTHSLKRNPDNNSLCLDEACHSAQLIKDGGLSGIIVAGDISGHTKHKVDKNFKTQPEAGEGSKCIRCHMPLMISPLTAADKSNHSFKILYPSETNLSGKGRMNSCMNGKCHTIHDNSNNKWDPAKEIDNNAATSEITNLWGNIAPIINIKKDNISYIDSTIILDGSKSFDPNDSTYPYNDNLIFKWILKKGQFTAALDNYSSSDPSFKSEFPGEYEFELIVNDGLMDSKPAALNIIIRKK